MKMEEMIAAVQEELGVQVDGRAGPETWSAIYARIVGAAQPIDEMDPRSEKNILTLLPEVQPMARALIQKAALNGIRIKVISGLRTYAEQDALYAQGRTKPGPKVTNVRGGYSNHNFGIAFDVGVFESNKYLAESVKYKAVGVLGSDLGLEGAGIGRRLLTSRTSSCVPPGRPTSPKARCWPNSGTGWRQALRSSPDVRNGNPGQETRDRPRFPGYWRDFAGRPAFPGTTLRLSIRPTSS